MPGIEPATSWLVVRHADHSVNEAVNDNNNKKKRRKNEKWGFKNKFRKNILHGLWSRNQRFNIAQVVERRARNREVRGSNPGSGSNFSLEIL